MAVVNFEGDMGMKYGFSAMLSVPVDPIDPPTYGGPDLLASPRLRRVSIIMPDIPTTEDGYPTRSP